MATLLIIIHIVACLFLISVVLLQSGKGAEIGAAFGGSSQTLFGSRGAATFLNKLTTAAAIVFMLTSLTLTMITTKSSSIIKQTAPADQKAVPQQQAPLQPQPQTPVPQKPPSK
ncbi:MAG: preprotein translocase subunit SecG [Nitrospirae bacterium]|nr:preprotein translocase subunit SecG [Nitrospirota bacterium]MCL5236231.1 preprotein translocase subunit SecG [Nitrospirota bacterium]